MPAKPKKKTGPTDLSINFLRLNQDGVSIAVVDWISRLGLPIVVVISAVVFGCSFYKMTLDQRLATLQEEIHAVATTIQADQNFFYQLDAISQKYEDTTDFWLAEKITDLIPILTKTIPSGITLNDLSIAHNNVRFAGQAMNETAVAQLVSNLELLPNVAFPNNQQVSVDNLRVDRISSTIINDQIGYEFSVRFEYEVKDIASNT
ncbi:PilN domain-containing protein [Microgenomates group bacterium]|nr:PilN domain-containing protein [Microgenomates group bacterium]